MGIHASPSPQRTAKAQPSTKRGELAPVHPLPLTQRGPVNCALREGALWASTVMRRLGAPARAGVTPWPAFSLDHVTCGCSGQAEPQLCPLKWAERTSSQAAEEMWGDVGRCTKALTCLRSCYSVTILTACEGRGGAVRWAVQSETRLAAQGELRPQTPTLEHQSKRQFHQLH